MLRPYLRVRCPRPPPSVRPPTPVVEMMPLGMASPCSWVARSSSPSVQPPPTRTVRACGSTSIAVQRGEIDHDAVVARAEARAVVPAAAYGDQQIPLAGEGDDLRDVGSVGAARDQRGVAVDHRVVDGPRVVVVAVARLDQTAAEPASSSRALMRVVMPRRYEPGRGPCHDAP